MKEKTMHPLHKKIVDAKSRKRCALIPFLTANYPDRENFWNALQALAENGADIIEIGVPFSDPVADGPVVESASIKSLTEGFNLKCFLKELAGRRESVNAELVLMGYYNPFLQYGLENLAMDAQKAGVAGFIIPDLPYPENLKFKEIAAKKGLALIPLVGPNTSPERMRLYAKDAEGYAYVVSVMGITGERKKLSQIINDVLRLAKKCFDVPVALGFGLSQPAQLNAIAEDAMPDAAVFGSSLIKHINQGKPVQEFMQIWQD